MLTLYIDVTKHNYTRISTLTEMMRKEIGLRAVPRTVSVKRAVIRTLCRPAFVSMVKPSRTEANVIWRVLGALTATFMNQ